MKPSSHVRQWCLRCFADDPRRGRDGAPPRHGGAATAPPLAMSRRGLAASPLPPSRTIRVAASLPRGRSASPPRRRRDPDRRPRGAARVVADVGRVVVDGARVAGHALSGRVALRVVADDVRPALGARLGPVLCVQRGVSDLVVTDYLALRRGVATSAEYRRLFAAATSPRNIQAFATASPRRVSTEYRQLFAAAATSPRNIQVLAAASPRRLHGISSSPPRCRRDSSRRNTHISSPRRRPDVSTEYPAFRRGVAATSGRVLRHASRDAFLSRRRRGACPGPCDHVIKRSEVLRGLNVGAFEDAAQFLRGSGRRPRSSRPWRACG